MPTDHDPERADLLDALRTQRFLFLHTVDGLDDDLARERTTVSELTLGGLVKHVSAMETQWCDFIEGGADALAPDDGKDWLAGFAMTKEETLDGLVFIHLLAEIAQHAGHADILREAHDGQKTMG